MNDQQYVEDDPRRLLAIGGDTRIEAAMVPYRDTVHARLSAATEPDERAYFFQLPASERQELKGRIARCLQ